MRIPPLPLPVQHPHVALVLARHGHALARALQGHRLQKAAGRHPCGKYHHLVATAIASHLW